MARTVPTWTAREDALVEAPRVLSGRPIRGVDWTAIGRGANLAHVAHGVTLAGCVAYRDAAGLAVPAAWAGGIVFAVPGPGVSRVRVRVWAEKTGVGADPVITLTLPALASVGVSITGGVGEYVSTIVSLQAGDLTAYGGGYYSTGVWEVKPEAGLTLYSVAVELVEVPFETGASPGWPVNAGTGVPSGVVGAFVPADDDEAQPGEPIAADLLFDRAAQWPAQWTRLQQRACWFDFARASTGPLLVPWPTSRMRAVIAAPILPDGSARHTLAVKVGTAGGDALTFYVCTAAEDGSLAVVESLTIAAGAAAGVYTVDFDLTGVALGGPAAFGLLAPIAVVMDLQRAGRDSDIAGPPRAPRDALLTDGWDVECVAVWGP
jgi:hypothetical protein